MRQGDRWFPVRVGAPVAVGFLMVVVAYIWSGSPGSMVLLLPGALWLVRDGAGRAPRPSLIASREPCGAS